MDYSIQSAEIYGTVYVGGGNTDEIENLHVVMAFNMDSCIWSTLPPYKTKWFAITTFNNRLILVGGLGENHSASNELGEWQSDQNQWSYPFPPLCFARVNPSAVSYKHWLVVAGGSCHGKCLNDVEVFDACNRQWSTGPSTPKPWEGKKSTTVCDTWYLMGGWDGKQFDCDVFSVSLGAIVSHLEADNSNIWKKLPSLNSIMSCPVGSGTYLLAVGGENRESNEPVSTIQAHLSDRNTWIHAGDLQIVQSECTCVKMSDNFLIIGGSDGNSKLNLFYVSLVL